MPTGPSLSQPSPTVAAGDIGDEVRVVVVDDSAVIRRVLAGVIKQAAGVTLVGQAINGREALTVIETEHPDVVVLDVEMPVLDGLGALREAKRRWPGLPIVMFSTLTEAGAAATLKALSEGADDYLTKPISTNGPVGAFDAVREQLVPLLVAWGEIGRQRAARRGAARERQRLARPDGAGTSRTWSRQLGPGDTGADASSEGALHASGADGESAGHGPGTRTAAASAGIAPAGVLGADIACQCARTQPTRRSAGEQDDGAGHRHCPWYFHRWPQRSWDRRAGVAGRPRGPRAHRPAHATDVYAVARRASRCP